VLIALNTDYHGRNPDALCAEQIAAGRREEMAEIT
jgi:hypothetical protein